MKVYIKQTGMYGIKEEEIDTNNLGEYLYDYYNDLSNKYHTSFSIRVLDKNTYVVNYYAVGEYHAVYSTNYKAALKTKLYNYWVNN